MARTYVKAVPTRLKAELKATNIWVSENSRAEVAEALSRFLASSYNLYQKSLYYHWNVTGSHFLSLHKLFEEHYEEIHKAVDEIAERIRAMGYFSPGTLSDFASLSTIREDSELPDSDFQMVANLLKNHENCTKEAKEVFFIAEKSEDQVTMDLMVKRMAFHEKAAWMLRAFES